jgi:hypothetical protein
MKPTVHRFVQLVVLAVTLGLAACSDQSPVQPLTPSENLLESLSLEDDLRALANGQRPDLSVRYHETIIGPEGGSLYVDLHYLNVPRGAVTGPTKFTLRLRDDFRLGAKLTATSVDASGNPTGPTNNVGSAGFPTPLYLTFSYQFATDAPADPNDVRVVELRNGVLVPQPTYVYPWYKAATGLLYHFSDYGLAWPSRTVSSVTSFLLR